MDLGTIFNVINYIIDKDATGEVFTPENYNDVLELVNLELNNEEEEVLKQIMLNAGNIPYNLADLYDGSPLRAFKIPVVNANVVDGYYTLPDNYSYRISARSKVPYVFRDIEFVTDTEANKRITGILNNSLEENPIGIVGKDKIEFYPNDITKIDFVYIKIPNTPYFDYCINNNNGMTIYMPVGYYVKPSDVGGLYDLYDDSDVIVQADVTYPNYTGNPSMSQTVELEWNVKYYIKIIIRILEKSGINIGNEMVEQYAQLEQKKGE